MKKSTVNMLPNHCTHLLLVLLLGLVVSCQARRTKPVTNSGGTANVAGVAAGNREYGANITPGQPKATSGNKFAKILGWAAGAAPTATPGYRVIRFAENLNSPRNIYVAPNGDIFVAQARTEKPGEDDEKVDSRNKFRAESPNSIIRFRDRNKDGIPEENELFLSGLSQPYGMLVLGNYFYVANTDGVVRFPYNPSTGTVVDKGEKIVSLPAGGYNNHWTRNIITNRAGTKIYIAVGSGSNVGENGMDKEVRRAAILEVEPDGTNECVFASGLRNPVGIAFEPSSNVLWAAVNERDELGDELVPDYITSVKKDGFYGWPYSYWGAMVDPRWQGKGVDSLIRSAITPDYAVGAHTASLGLAFSTIPAFSEGAYIGQHGSWNRSELVGYKVMFVPFEDGRPAGQPQDFLTGFVADADAGEVYGRPVAVAFTDRYLLVTDDAANVIWAVVPE